MVEVRLGRNWVLASGLLWACGGGGTASEPAVATSGAEELTAEAPAGTKTAASNPTTAKPEAEAPKGASVAAKATLVSECTPKAGAEPKLVTGEDSVSDVAETGRPLHFDVAGISVELPACTPEADLNVINVSWETQERPISSHIDEKFTRHAATLRMDQPIKAAEGAPLVVALHSHRELTKPGEKMVLAVEYSGECTGRYKRDKLEWGDCSHWTIYDVNYDTKRKEMVAQIPSVGGYRMQFGWMPK